MPSNIMNATTTKQKKTTATKRANEKLHVCVLGENIQLNNILHFYFAVPGTLFLIMSHWSL